MSPSCEEVEDIRLGMLCVLGNRSPCSELIAKLLATMCDSLFATLIANISDVAKVSGVPRDKYGSFLKRFED